VIAHNAIAANTHGEPFGAFGKYLLKSEKVVIFAKYAQPAIGSIQCVVNISA
jgi:hypothetical protein